VRGKQMFGERIGHPVPATLRRLTHESRHSQSFEVVELRIDTNWIIRQAVFPAATPGRRQVIGDRRGSPLDGQVRQFQGQARQLLAERLQGREKRVEPRFPQSRVGLNRRWTRAAGKHAVEQGHHLRGPQEGLGGRREILPRRRAGGTEDRLGASVRS